MRLIDADAWDSFYADMVDSRNMMDSYAAGYTVALDQVGDWMDAQPTIEAEPVKHGRWIDNGIPESMLSKCSVCDYSCGAYSFNYCPNCGADMRERRDNNAD